MKNFLFTAFVLLLLANQEAMGQWQHPWTMAYRKSVAIGSPSRKSDSSRHVTALPSATRGKGAQILSITNTTDVLLQNSTTNTMSENSVAIQPSDLAKDLNSNNSIPGATTEGANDDESTDGGMSWTVKDNGTGEDNGGDPSVAIDNDGKYFVDFIDDNNGQSIAVSTDAGSTWTTHVIATTSVLLDKPDLTVDNSTNSSYNTRLYCGWTDFGSSQQPIEVSFSTDHGSNWSTPTNISSALSSSFSLHQGVSLRTGPNGEVYAAWALYPTGGSLTEAGIGFSKSTDGGSTWSDATKIFSINGDRVAGLQHKTMRMNSFPSMGVNRQNGDIYIVWTEFLAATSETDVMFRKSTDGGSTWSNAVRVNNDNTHNDEWFPWIACDPISGAIAVVFYDSRNFTGNDRAETFVAVSFDEGATWGDQNVVSDGNWSGDATTNPIFAGGYAGDYIGIDVNFCRAIPIWTEVLDAPNTDELHTKSSEFDVDCPTDLNLCNADIFDKAMYSVSQTLSVAGSGCTYTVEHNAHAIMTAGGGTAGLIKLENGFHAVSGSKFHAYIVSDCSQFCEMASEFSSHNIAKQNPPTITPSATIFIQNQKAKIVNSMNFPNPFKNSTEIEYYLPTNTPVKLVIYDIMGNEVRVLTDENQSSGNHSIIFDASSLPSGTYFYRLQTAEGVVSQSMQLMK